MDNERQMPKQTALPSAGKANGFTLVELMVTLAVAAILIAMAGPSFTTMIANQRAKDAATAIYMSLTKARGEALKRNTSVTLQPVTSGQWQDGWYIPDPTAAATGKLDDHGPLKGLTISGPSVTYRSSGRVLGTGTPPTFTISATGTDTRICVNVDLTGRPYQKTTTTSSSC